MPDGYPGSTLTIGTANIGGEAAAAAGKNRVVAAAAFETCAFTKPTCAGGAAVPPGAWPGANARFSGTFRAGLQVAGPVGLTADSRHSRLRRGRSGRAASPLPRSPDPGRTSRGRGGGGLVGVGMYQGWNAAHWGWAAVALGALVLFWRMGQARPDKPTDKQVAFIEQLFTERDAGHLEDVGYDTETEASRLIDRLLRCDRMEGGDGADSGSGTGAGAVARTREPRDPSGRSG